MHYRITEAKPANGQMSGRPEIQHADDDTTATKARLGVTQDGLDMIGDYHTDVLQELTVPFMAARGSVGMQLGSSAKMGGFPLTRIPFASLLAALVDVFSCRHGMSNSGLVSRAAGDTVGTDGYLPDMGTEDFLVCLSRQALGEPPAPGLRDGAAIGVSPGSTTG